MFLPIPFGNNPRDFTETMPQQLTTYVHTLCTVHRKHDFALTLSQKDNPNLYLKVSEKTPVCKRPYRHGLCWGGKGWFNHVSVSRHSFQKSLPSTLFLFVLCFPHSYQYFWTPRFLTVSFFPRHNFDFCPLCSNV